MAIFRSTLAGSASARADFVVDLNPVAADFSVNSVLGVMS
jgi:hypothetical protein